MGLCKDKYVTFLNGYGYNVIRLPRAGIDPLMLIGRQSGTTSLLGDVALLVDPPGSGNPRPPVQVELDAAPLKGQQSSELDVGLGLNLLGTFVGALGGDVGVKTQYKNARTITFQFDDVVVDRTLPGDVGEYLKKAKVNAENLVLQQYVLGNGDLFVITEVLKSKAFSVSATRDDGTDLQVDVPVVQKLAGGNVKVSGASAARTSVTYAGQRRLAFGFACFHVGVEDGKLSMIAHKASDATALALAVPDEGGGGVLIGTGGLLPLAQPL